jgi:hypothetical protein
MTPDQEIDRLDELLSQLHNNHPNTYGTLRITNMTFRACTQQRWADHNWVVTDEEAVAIMHGNDEERKAALLELLLPQYINQVEILPGVDIIEVVVPEAPTVDQV